MGRINNYDYLVNFIINQRESFYRLAYSYVRNKEDALDIIQESICKALSKAKGLESQEAVKSWFYRIVVNTSLDFLRKNKRYVYVEDEVLEAVSPSAEDQYEDIDLRAAIEKLPTLNKTVIMLRYYEDMKIEDIARIMNENVNTTKTRLYSSLKKLRITLDKADD
ncbi:MAG TPA: sigma-70 family RNA polymerase sigma factor [Clostridiales bacterium]|nr:sigma-70 family RNA polymerase sigma factor [Clostridiales bacterium]